MNVPLLDLTFQNHPLKKDFMAAFENVLDANRFIMGPDITALEEEVADYCSANGAVGVSSGTDALIVSLMALNVQPGDEIITTPYTFFATGGSIHRLGAKPVFVDIDPDTYNLDPRAVEAAVTPKTVGMLPVHLYGQCADMDPLLATAKKHGLWIVEDGAQAIGSAYKGRRAGSMGDTGCFSFFPSKNLGGFGDGGLVTFMDKALGDKISLLRGHGAKPKYYHSMVGGNFRLDALQAAILRIKLKHLDSWTEQRQANADDYRSRFQAAGISEELLKLPAAPTHEGDRHIYNQFILQTPKRDELKNHLQKVGVGCEIYYPLPLHLQECFSYLSHREGDFPVSEKAARETLAIPIYNGLVEEQRAYVVEQVCLGLKG